MSNDKYELLCQPTDDDDVVNRERIIVPFKNDDNIYPDNEVSIITKKNIMIILISISSIILIILFGVLVKRLYINYKKSSYSIISKSIK